MNINFRCHRCDKLFPLPPMCCSSSIVVDKRTRGVIEPPLPIDETNHGNEYVAYFKNSNEPLCEGTYKHTFTAENKTEAKEKIMAEFTNYKQHRKQIGEPLKG